MATTSAQTLPTSSPRQDLGSSEQRSSTPEKFCRKDFQPPKICTTVRCTVPNCKCDCFVPGKIRLRYCENCNHGWVPHALDKLGLRHLFSISAYEPVDVNAVSDVASLILYGCQTIPIRLKLLLDRLLSVLSKEQVIRVLHGFGWTADDYSRGYILQQSYGSTLDRWSICNPEEEPLVLQQFLRFGETRAITQQLLLAQQALQDRTLERLERRHSPHLRAMSPSRRPSPPTVPPPPFHPQSHTMSPHQKHPLGFLKMPPAVASNGPISSTSPPTSISSSPLNRLQNMQPFDYRKLGPSISAFSNRVSPEMTSRRRTGETEPPSVGLNLSMATSLPNCLPPPPPPPPTSLAHSAAAMAAAANSLAAASLVASSFPGLMTARMSTGRSKSPDMFCGNSEEEDADENSQSVLNLSRDASSKTPKHGVRALPGRKPSTPTKRQWGSPGLPLNLGTQFINPATGKKRVQCNVCLKTFCDKGALKIHFSAVHLREMHKCTVEGCNMMFSSRRSRNRHSANPNPKLHSPHLRRKISPHDGRSSQSHPLLIPPQTGLSLPAAAAALNPLNPFGPFPLLTPPPDMKYHSLATMDFKQTLDLSMQRIEENNKHVAKDFAVSALVGNQQTSEEEEDDDDGGGIVVVGGDDDDETMPEKCDETNQPKDFSMPAKKQKMSVSDADSNEEDSSSVVDNHSLKDEANVSTNNKRKRKSQNPTRCAVATAMTDDAVSDADSSNDDFVVDASKKNDQVERRESSPLDLGAATRSPDVNANEPEKTSEIKTSLAPLFSIDKSKKEKPLHEADAASSHEETDERPASSVESNKSDESFDALNPLRHLESLSHGHFGDMMTRGLHLGLSSASQFPPLGFMMGPPSPARSQASSAGSSNGAESADENSQNQIFGHFDNGQFISTMDVPIDKDNPRRCTACGKIFQNHFGVKTHYQNVHLKLMHKCNVDGCNAAFPSKRSRDRHSANLNLHRKLLSTSSDKSGGSLSPFNFAANPTLHGDFLTRFYAEEALKGGHHLPPPNLDQLILNGDRIPHPPLLLPPLGNLPFPLSSFGHFNQFNGNSTRKERSSSSSSPQSSSPPPLNLSPGPVKYVHCVEEDLPTPDRDGNLPCRFCRTTFSNPSQLKDHCERNHLGDMFKCTVMGCPKVFVSRTRRNVHSENEASHATSTAKNDSDVS
ncbi:zinc finger protein basonuclin-2-like [Cylas formicarius]|uniref:zinc finger protein basonuclin-2-like n=1 Tax=Cylas formicarius TaxID=197179 RepID=UPI0029586910|nr:zinc finger protein basonuclin-2-like [Cylas formicarius]